MKKKLHITLLGLGLALGAGMNTAVSGPPCSYCEELLHICETQDDMQACRQAFSCFRWCS